MYRFIFTLALALASTLSSATPTPAQHAYVQAHGVDKARTTRTLAALDREATRHGIDLRLLIALVKKESTFKPRAVSPDGSLGLFQVRAKVHGLLLRSLGVTDIFNIEQNAKAGAHLLARYIQTSPSLFIALKRYSGGSSAYARQLLKLHETIPH